MPNLRGGGAERVYTNLANTWTKQGLEIVFLLNKKDGPFLIELNQNIRVIDLNVKRIRQTFFLLPKIIKREKPDIFLSAMWPLTSISIVLSKLFFLKTKIVISDHVNLTKSIKYETNFNYFLFKFILFVTYRFADGIICVSKGVKKNVIKISKLREDRIIVIYNPIISNENKYDNSNFIKAIKKNCINFLNIGSLKIQKNQKLLINAFSQLDNSYDVNLLIVGDGPEKQNLITLIKEKKQEHRIFIKDFDLDVEQYYLRSDFFILSSEWEGFGNVLVEALHYGLNIISTNCDYGPAEILDYGKYGDLVKVNDTDSLTKIMEKKIKEFKREFNYINYLRSLDYSVSKIAKNYLDYFYKIL